MKPAHDFRQDETVRFKRDVKRTLWPQPGMTDNIVAAGTLAKVYRLSTISYDVVWVVLVGEEDAFGDARIAVNVHDIERP